MPPTFNMLYSYGNIEASGVGRTENTTGDGQSQKLSALFVFNDLCVWP